VLFTIDEADVKGEFGALKPISAAYRCMTIQVKSKVERDSVLCCASPHEYLIKIVSHIVYMIYISNLSSDHTILDNTKATPLKQKSSLKGERGYF